MLKSYIFVVNKWSLTIDKSLLLFFSFSSCLSVIHSEAQITHQFEERATHKSTVCAWTQLITPLICLLGSYQFSSSVDVLQILWWFPSSSRLIPNKQEGEDAFNSPKKNKQNNAKHDGVRGSHTSHLRFLLCFSTSAFRLLYFAVRYTKTQVIPEKIRRSLFAKRIQVFWTTASVLQHILGGNIHIYTIYIYF